jgi:hypothetical protein
MITDLLRQVSSCFCGKEEKPGVTGIWNCEFQVIPEAK